MHVKASLVMNVRQNEDTGGNANNQAENAFNRINRMPAQVAQSR